jgi:hypothetical protein
MPIDPSEVAWEKPYSAINPNEVKWDKPFEAKTTVSQIGTLADASREFDKARGLDPDRPPTTWKDVAQLGKTGVKMGTGVLGGVAGGALAGAAALPAGPAAAWTAAKGGAGVGFDIGTQAGEQLVGERPLNATYQPNYSNIALGTAADILPDTAPYIARGLNAVGDIYEKGIPASWNEMMDSLAKRKAAESIEAQTSKTAEGRIPDQIAKNKAESERLEEEIPGLQFNLGQQGSDPNLLSLARQRGLSPGTGSYLSGESVMGQKNALENYINRDIVGSGKVEDFLDLAKQRQQSLANQSGTAKEAAEKVAQGLEGTSEQDVGKELLNKAKVGRVRSAEKAEELKAAIPGDLKISTAPLWDKVNDMFGSYDNLLQRLTAPPTKTMSGVQTKMTPEPPSELINPATNKPFPVTAPEKMSMDEIRKFSSEVTKGQRDAYASGENQLAYNFGELKDAIDDTLALAAEKGEGEGVKSLQDYWAYWRDTHIPTYRHGPTGEILRKTPTGEQKVANSSIGGEFFKSGKNAVEAADSFNRTFGDDPEAKALIRDYAAQSLLKAARNPATGELEDKLVARWMFRHKTALNKLGLSDEFGGLPKALDIAKQAQAREAEFNDSALGKALGDTDPQRAIKSALLTGPGRKESISQIKKLTALASSDVTGAALEGLRAGIGQTFKEQVGNAALDLAQRKLDSFAKVDKFVQEFYPALKASGLYSDKQLAAWQNVRSTLGKISQQARPAGYNNSLTPEVFMRAAVSKLGGIPGKIASGAYGMLSSGLKERVGDTIAQAVFDPRHAEILRDFINESIKKTPEAAARKFTVRLDSLKTLPAATLATTPPERSSEPQPDQRVDLTAQRPLSDFEGRK